MTSSRIPRNGRWETILSLESDYRILMFPRPLSWNLCIAVDIILDGLLDTGKLEKVLSATGRPLLAFVGSLARSSSSNRPNAAVSSTCARGSHVFSVSP